MNGNILRTRAFLVASIALLAAADCEARYAGTVSSGSLLTFTSNSQSVWGAERAVEGYDASFDLFNASVPRTSPSFGQKVSLWGGTFGGVLKPTFGWNMALSGRLYDFDAGKVKLEWPAVVTLTVDEPNSYAPGDTVTIDSSYRVPGSGYLSATPTVFAVDLKGKFTADFSASLEGCLGACASYSIFPNRSFNKDFTLLRLSNKGLSYPDVPASRSYSLPHLMSWCESAVTNVEGYIDFPNGYATLPGTTAYLKACTEAGAPTDFIGGNGENEYSVQFSEREARSGKLEEVFQQETSYRFLDLSVDLDGLVDPTSLLGNDTPSVAGVYGSYNLLDLSSNLNLAYKQSLKFEPDLKLRIEFPQTMMFRVAGAEWQTASSAVMTVGESLELKLPPAGSIPWNNSTVYLLDNSFTSTTTIDPGADVNYSAATIDAHLPPVTGFAETIMKEVCTCPSWDVTGLICLAAKVCRSVVDYVTYHDYGKVDIHGAIVNEKTIAASSWSVPLHSHTGTLGGIAPQEGAPLTIDPESPQVKVEAEVSRVVNHGGGKRTVVYTVAVDNAGDVPLKDVASSAPLAEAFSAAVSSKGSLRSCDSAVNPRFGSNSSWDIFDGPVLLDDGRDPNPAPVAPRTGGVVQVEVEVRPGLYPSPFEAHFNAAGTSWFRNSHVSAESRPVVELGPARLDALEKFAVYADKKVLLKEPALIRGSLGSNGSVEVQNGGNTLIAGDLRALGQVNVQGGVTVDYIFTNLLLNLGASGTVNGRQRFEISDMRELNEYVVPVMEGFQLPTVDGRPDGPSLDVSAKTAGAAGYGLPRGEYGTVKVAAGAKLILRGDGGKGYSFRDLLLEDGATVLFDTSSGAVTVHVEHGLKVGSNVAMTVASVAGSTRDVAVNIGVRGKVDVGKNARVIGTWVAPSASVTLGAGSRLDGALYAEMVTMEKGSIVEQHEEPWTGSLYLRYNDSCSKK